MKWLTGGTLAGSLPFTLLYIVPFRVDAGAARVDAIFGGQPGVDSAVLRLRHHSLPVDGRGHYFQARPGVYGGHRGVAAIYFALVALIAEIFHAQTTGPVGGMIAIVIAAFLFQPFREVDSGATGPISFIATGWIIAGR